MSKARKERMRRLKKKRSWSGGGALEGLPLQLIILVVIAGIAISVLVAWMTVFSEKPLKDLEIAGISPSPTKGNNTLTNGIKYAVKIKALSTDGKPMSGVTVTMEGTGISQIAATGSEGIASFSGITPSLGANENIGMITVSAKYKTWSVSGIYLGVEG